MSESLLPSSAGPFEQALSQTNAARIPGELDHVRKLATLWNWWTCAPEELPLLAWARSVDIWDETWPIERKRRVVAEADRFHELKTTVAGYRMALGYEDATLLRANLPRHGFFLGSPPSVESQAAWLAGLPLIRIISGEPTRRPGRAGFIVGKTALGDPDDLVVRRQRAELIRDGVVTRLVISGVRVVNGMILTEAERLVIPAPPANVFRVGRALAGRPLASGVGVEKHVVTPRYSSGFWPAATTGLTPIETSSVVTYPGEPTTGAVVVGRALAGRYLRAAQPPVHSIRTFRLADGSAPDGARRTRNRLGVTRLRRERFTAGLLVYAPTAPVRAFPVRGHVLRPGPEPKIARLEHAIAVTGASRDTLFLDFTATRAATFGDLARLPQNARYGVAIRL